MPFTCSHMNLCTWAENGEGAVQFIQYSLFFFPSLFGWFKSYDIRPPLNLVPPLATALLGSDRNPILTFQDCQTLMENVMILILMMMMILMFRHPDWGRLVQEEDLGSPLRAPLTWRMALRWGSSSSSTNWLWSWWLLIVNADGHWCQLELESLKVWKAEKGGKRRKRQLWFCNQPFGKRSVIM